MSSQAWSYLLEAGDQEGLHITALHQDLVSQSPYVLQLPRLQPAGEKEFLRVGNCSGNSGASLSLGQIITHAALISPPCVGAKQAIKHCCGDLWAELSDS